MFFTDCNYWIYLVFDFDFSNLFLWLSFEKKSGKITKKNVISLNKKLIFISKYYIFLQLQHNIEWYLQRIMIQIKIYVFRIEYFSAWWNRNTLNLMIMLWLINKNSWLNKNSNIKRYFTKVAVKNLNF